jgi:tRNA threonylcarbamoyladenosine biosynthesis protein TsaE
VKFKLDDAAATEALGAALADFLRKHSGAVVFLKGELGAGKTTLARGLLRALGATGVIRSPTYTLMEIYELQGKTLLHMDLYRLSDPLELTQLGLADYPPRENCWLVEWPERGGELLPSADLTVELRVQDRYREAQIRLTDPTGASALAEALAGVAASADHKLLQE